LASVCVNLDIKQAIMKFFVFVLMLFPLMAYGQEAKLEVSVSRDTVLMGNEVKVVYTAYNVEGEFVAPKLTGLSVSQGPMTSSSYVFSNGASSRQVSYTYYLKPEKEGKATIGPAGFKNDNQNLQTSELKIFVKANPKGIKESPDGQARERNPGDVFGDMGDIFKQFPRIEDIFKDRQDKQAPPQRDSTEKYKFKTEKL